MERISRDADGNLRIRERWGREASYPAVVTTCQSWLLSTRIHTEEALFPAELWTAIERSHYMQSSKTFVMVDRPFWKDIDPETGREVLSMTLTDRLNRATYLLDNGPDQPAVILLSYTWNDDALKWLALDADERVELMLHSLEQIYPGVDIASHIVGQPITVSWEADPNFMGAFKANLPGHYRYQQRLFTHFKQDQLPESQRGIFLAGDDVSFTAGWAEGAVTTGLNAVWGVVNHLGGSSAAGNPGPGDLLDELGPDQPGLSGAGRASRWELCCLCVEFAVRLGELAVARRVALHAVELLIGEFAADLGRDPGHQRAGRDYRAFQHDGAGRHERAGADHRAVEDGGAHADEAVVLHGAAMDDGAVPDADPRPDAAGEAGVGMQHHVVLQVAAGAHGDGGGVGAHRDAVERTGVLGERGTADD